MKKSMTAYFGRMTGLSSRTEVWSASACFLDYLNAKICAEIFALRGALTAIDDSRGEAAQSVSDEIRQQRGVRTVSLECDVAAQWADVEAAVRNTANILGGLHYALNAAGLPVWLVSDRPRSAETTIECVVLISCGPKLILHLSIFTDAVAPGTGTA